MGFKKVDCIAEKENIMKEDRVLKKYIEEFDKEYAVMQAMVRVRKKAGLTQREISMKSGLTQQMVSRMEKVNNSPTLANFLKYISALDLDINFIEKKIKN